MCSTHQPKWQKFHFKNNSIMITTTLSSLYLAIFMGHIFKSYFQAYMTNLNLLLIKNTVSTPLGSARRSFYSCATNIGLIEGTSEEISRSRITTSSNNVRPCDSSPLDYLRNEPIHTFVVCSHNWQLVFLTAAVQNRPFTLVTQSSSDKHTSSPSR